MRETEYQTKASIKNVDGITASQLDALRTLMGHCEAVIIVGRCDGLPPRRAAWIRDDGRDYIKLSDGSEAV